MSDGNLVDQILCIQDERERQAFLEVHCHELTPGHFEEWKARSDAMLLEQPRRALEIAEVALQAAFFVAGPLAEAAARWARGNAWVYLGDQERALEDYERACAIYRQQGEEGLAVARLQANMVSVLKNLGRYADALRLADVARDALKPWAQSRYMAALEMNVGSTCRLLGRYEDALAAYERGRAVFAALGDEVQVARMDVNRARVLVCMDRFREAEAILEAARQVFDRCEKPVPAARAELNRATLLSRQGRHREALEAYDRARSAFAGLGVETDVAVTDLYRTVDYLALNLLPEAMATATQAREVLARHHMPRYVALAAGNQAIAARKLGRYAEALEAIADAQAILAERGARVEVALLDLERAICLAQAGELEQAAERATGAIQVLDGHDLPLQAARARLTLADCLLALGETGQAASLYRSALDALAGMPVLAWQAHDGLGQAAETLGQTKSACRHYQQAIACLEAAEEKLGIDEFRAGFLDDKLGVYQRAVRLALALGDQEAAFGYAEQSKVGVWRDSLALPPAGAAGAAEERLTRLRDLRRRWHWLYSRLTRPEEDEEDPGRTRWGSSQEAEAELHTLEQQIATVRRQSSQALERHPGPSLAEVQQRVPDDALLIDYYCTPDQVIAFVIGPTSAHAYAPLASLDAVERAVNRWKFNVESVRFAILDGQRSLAAGLLDEAQGVLHALYRLLVEPLEPHMANACLLGAMPHGILWSVPFAALYDGRQYLVDRFVLACLPGLTAPAQCRRQGMPALLTRPLIVGYADGGRLAHAVDEARAVARTLGRGTLLLEDEATMDRVQNAAATCTMLHLSTHGSFRADAPLFSTLRLADGWLIAYDLETWDMPHVELATLSACESGAILSRGSDLLGLARGFFRAGARQLVIALWTVDDASTARLMARFYRALQEGRQVAPALQEAQIATRDAYPHPFYWAGFEAMGLL